ncbi:TetR/AcrR family transcriptional regulator [Desulfococcus sp.]|uniref:TetR/AcrR family transcriptional regulator n=1 Tax=Desulfococcus sp. TaxID=2025834 RepID=UPI003593CCA0
MSSMKDTIRSIAIELFFRKGYFATSISDIAKGSGIQKASIYYHYKSKEELLFSILKSTMDDLTRYLKENLSGLEDIEAKIRAAVHGHVRFHLERQKENFIANSELRGLSRDHYRIIVERRDEYEEIFQDLIRQGKEQGVFGNVDVKILSYAILTLCTAGASWFNPGGRLTVDEIADIYENFIVDGLKQGGQCLYPPEAAHVMR